MYIEFGKEKPAFYQGYIFQGRMTSEALNYSLKIITADDILKAVGKV